MDPVVELDSGFIRGLIEKHEDGFDYYSFKGIPFAEPPIGELRFEDPVPKKPWTGILDCITYGPLSMQHDFITTKESYDENCLHLNVYTKLINKTDENLPVIVWIHGGEFTYGNSGDAYCGPDYLIRKNIVFATINFRLGVLGFLDLKDEVAAGNQGLKDQVMALQWVQKNIRMFGGNPDNVTVGGGSAGGASAHYLALSPLAKNLVHKIFCHGGIIYNPWTGTSDPKSHAVKLCSLLGKTLTDSKEIVKFLKTVDTKSLLEAQQRLLDILDCMTFGPGADTMATTPFMPVDRYIAADQGVHIPSLVGYTSREGLLALYDRYQVNQNQIKRLYYQNEVVSEVNVDKYVDFAGDIHFVEGIHRFARKQAETSSATTYVYRFDYESEISMTKAVLKGNTLKGVGHFDPLAYLLKMGLIKDAGGKYVQKGTKDYKIMEQMTEMWVNFATYGRPTIETSELIPVHWKPNTDGKVLRYMNICEDLTMQTTINLEEKFLSARDIKV